MKANKTNKETSFARGFKTWAENTSESLRAQLGLAASDPLPYILVARYLGVLIWELTDIPGLSKQALKHLSSQEGDDWSALTVSAERTVVVLNPSHSPFRQSSSAMHELAHVILHHQPGQIFISDTGIAIRTYDSKQENEADWLSGCLLLPRTALTHCLRSGFSERQISQKYGLSADLLNYRMRMTGVLRQFSKRRA